MVLECAGRLTKCGWKSFDRSLNEVTETRHSQVSIELSKLDYIDAARLGILLSLREGAMGRGKRIAIAGAVDSVHEILDIASFGSLFDIR